jgi:hypothetical protein
MTTADISRLIYLATYVNYDNTLMKTERTVMYKNDIKALVRCSNNKAFEAFYENMINNKFIMQQKDLSFKFNYKYFVKGKISIHKDYSYSRLFIEDIRHLFETVSARDIKKLGYLYQLLPYVSYEYNIICHNPIEKNIDLIKPMGLIDVATILGMTEQGFRKTLSSFGDIKTKKNESVLFYGTSGKESEKYRFIINPSILYRGLMNSDEIKAIKVLFKK